MFSGAYTGGGGSSLLSPWASQGWGSAALPPSGIYRQRLKSGLVSKKWAWGDFPSKKSSGKFSLRFAPFTFKFYFSIILTYNPPPSLYFIKNYCYMHYTSVSHVFPQPPWRRDFIRRGELGENKDNERLMKIFRRLLRTSESNTELYKGIALESGLKWAT